MRLSQGHRTYLDNPRLIVTRARKEPVPRGHRAYLEPNVAARCHINGDKREAVELVDRPRNRGWLK